MPETSLCCPRLPGECCAHLQVREAQSGRDFSSVERTVTDAQVRLCLRKFEAMEIVRWGSRASVISFQK